MKKVVFALALLALLIVACGPKTTGKRVSVPEPSGVTGAVTAPSQQTQQTPVSAEVESKSAAEVLEDLKSQGTTAVVPTDSGAKSGTFYPPVKVTGTGKDALAEKTRAYMSQSGPAPENVDAQGQFGAKYHDADGDSTNLPGEYGQEGSAGD